MAERDHQRVEEVERQRGYGEGFRKDEDVEKQKTPAAGYKEGSPVADQREADAEFVPDMQDERVPNVPNDDTDDASSTQGIEPHAGMKKKPDGHELEDAYSIDEPNIDKND